MAAFWRIVAEGVILAQNRHFPGQFNEFVEQFDHTPTILLNSAIQSTDTFLLTVQDKTKWRIAV